MNTELIPLNRFEGRFRAALMFEDAHFPLGMTRSNFSVEASQADADHAIG